MAAALRASALLLGLGVLLLLSPPWGVVGQGPLANCQGVFADSCHRVRFILETSTTNSSFSYENVTKLLCDPAYVAGRPTVLYMHGYRENRESHSVGVVSRAFIQRGSQNFLLVDWGPYAGGLYIAAIYNVVQVGQRVGQAVNDLVRAGLPRDDVWLVGHSLGGEMAHYVSRAMDFKPKRISALDPALPLYSLWQGYPHLTADDAVLVDVIHTDAGVFGFDRPMGHIDVWPNNGSRQQPGCQDDPDPVDPSLTCSHHRSYEFFAESVNSEDAFPGVRCGSYPAFLDGECPANEDNIVYMGYDAPITGQHGNFYMRTAGTAPYGLGFRGLVIGGSGHSAAK